MTDLALALITREKEEKTGKLDLEKSGLPQLLDALFELEWLEELIVSNRRWDAYYYLIGKPKLYCFKLCA